MGLAAAIGGIIGPALGLTAADTVFGTLLSTDIGGALLGAGGGALEGAVTGGNIGLDALTGGAGGFLGPIAGGALGEAVPSLAGLPANALGGAAVGAGLSGATGGNPLLGALEGGAPALIGGALNSAGVDVGSIFSGSGGIFGDTGVAGGTAGSGLPQVTDANAAPGLSPANMAAASGSAPPTTGGGVSAAGAAAPAGAALDPFTSGLLASPDVTGGTSVGQTITPDFGGATGGSTGGSGPINIQQLSGMDAPAASTTLGDWSPLPTAGSSPTAGVGGGGTATGGDFGGGPASTSGGFLSNLFGGGGSTAGTITATDAAGNTVSPTSSLATDFGGGGGSTSSGMLGGLGKTLSNPLTLLAGGGLLYDVLSQPSLPSTSSSIGPIQSQANQLTTQGSQLASYLQSGTLPPGAQQAINSAAASAKAQILSRYASMGGGAEGSSAAQQELANVDSVAATQGVQIAQQLLQTGISESQLGSQLYTELLNMTLQQDQALGSSISNFASALVPRTVTTVPAATAA